jgi:hypothetical protein
LKCGADPVKLLFQVNEEKSALFATFIAGIEVSGKPQKIDVDVVIQLVKASYSVE